MEQKNTFLKVMSILLIVFGIIAIIVSFGTIAMGAGGAALISQIDPGVGGVVAQYAGLLVFAGVLSLVAGVIELIAGIIGNKACKDPSKLKTCFMLGIVMIVIAIISVIFSAVGTGTFGGSTVGSLFMSVIVPVLYILAVKKAQPAA